MSATPNNCFHLTVEIVREIHEGAIGQFGGADGVRDLALLESAVAAPQASLGGRSPYKDIAEMAAAYLFFLCKNHAFIDGNKRAALGACIVFLRLNGIEPQSATGQSGRSSRWQWRRVKWTGLRPPGGYGNFCRSKIREALWPPSFGTI